MVIQNPYSEIPHKVFNRTFLQEVSASIKFVETPLLNNKEAITHFLKSNFGIIEYFPGTLTVGGITLSAETAVERYNFSTTSASLGSSHVAFLMLVRLISLAREIVSS